MKKLKAAKCPYCERDAEIVKPYYYIVRCPNKTPFNNCTVSAGTSSDHDTAIRDWNRRVKAIQLERCREYLNREDIRIARAVSGFM